jgi:hypothetical protein
MSRTSFLALAAYAFATFLLAGCGGSPPPPQPKPDAGHAHPSHGPHEGQLIELGNEEYHAELVHDDASKTIIVYLLGPDAKTAATSPDAEITLNLVTGSEPLQVKLTAEKQDGDPEGEASKFTVVDEKALEALENPKTTGHLNVNIAGKAYRGKVELGAHGHDHDH